MKRKTPRKPAACVFLSPSGKKFNQLSQKHGFHWRADNQQPCGAPAFGIMAELARRVELMLNYAE
jgi:hypothetical protein